MLILIFFLSCAVVTSIVLISRGIKKKKTPHLTENIIPLDPSNIIIAFDIHDVLFKLDYVKIPLVAVRSQHFYKLVKHAVNPFVLADIYLLWRAKRVSEKYFMHLTTKYRGLAECLPAFIALVNTQQPIHPMIDLIKALKQQGYSLHIFSNIGEHTIIDLQQKFPDVFEHFDVIQVTSADNDYLGKPHAPVFQRYLARCNHSKKSIIFIDDKKHNIEAARSHGIIGIQFTSSKQLKKDLQRIGVITK